MNSDEYTLRQKDTYSVYPQIALKYSLTQWHASLRFHRLVYGCRFDLGPIAKVTGLKGSIFVQPSKAINP